MVDMRVPELHLLYTSLHRLKQGCPDFLLELPAVSIAACDRLVPTSQRAGAKQLVPGSHELVGFHTDIPLWQRVHSDRACRTLKI